jgi:hypothetical protein
MTKVPGRLHLLNTRPILKREMFNFIFTIPLLRGPAKYLWKETNISQCNGPYMPGNRMRNLLTKSMT